MFRRALSQKQQRAWNLAARSIRLGPSPPQRRFRACPISAANQTFADARRERRDFAESGQSDRYGIDRKYPKWPWLGIVEATSLKRSLRLIEGGKETVFCNLDFVS